MGAAYVLAGVLVGVVICKAGPGSGDWAFLLIPAAALMTTAVCLEFHAGRRR